MISTITISLTIWQVLFLSLSGCVIGLMAGVAMYWKLSKDTEEQDEDKHD